ncbi:peptidoglycan editing factor PgeF [Candidatus Pelagibacter sp.]|nr:peptidoglycan editing factor PgeF [Candidatus Pelagibacter sp.]
MSRFSEISHGFFNKNGGVSKGIYKSLNCGTGSKDKVANIKKNLQIVRRKICKKSKEIFLVKQIHGNNFIFLRKNSNIKNRSVSADAIITEKINFPIAILTADCVPLLVFDKKRKMIAAIHAGWRGAYKGIITKVIKFMFRHGCRKEDMMVAIGPSISMKNYEVKKKFKDKFIKKHKGNIKFFKNKKNKIYFDLPNYAKKQVKLNQIKNINLLNIDTFDKKNNFFSARRSLKLNHNDYGRNISIIMIN